MVRVYYCYLVLWLHFSFLGPDVSSTKHHRVSSHKKTKKCSKVEPPSDCNEDASSKHQENWIPPAADRRKRHMSSTQFADNGVDDSEIASTSSLLPIRAERTDLKDPFRLGAGGIWAKLLDNLWTFKPFDTFKAFQAERDYNRRAALMEPHCCLCQYFVSRTLAKESDGIRTGSVRRLVTEMCFHKIGGDFPSLDIGRGANTTTDHLLTCSVCAITVHASCYLGSSKQGLERCGSADKWQCDRCMVRKC